MRLLETLWGQCPILCEFVGADAPTAPLVLPPMTSVDDNGSTHALWNQGSQDYSAFVCVQKAYFSPLILLDKSKGTRDKNI